MNLNFEKDGLFGFDVKQFPSKFLENIAQKPYFPKLREKYPQIVDVYRRTITAGHIVTDEDVKILFNAFKQSEYVDEIFRFLKDIHSFLIGNGCLIPAILFQRRVDQSAERGYKFRGPFGDQRVDPMMMKCFLPYIAGGEEPTWGSVTEQWSNRSILDDEQERFPPCYLEKFDENLEKIFIVLSNLRRPTFKMICIMMFLFFPVSQFIYALCASFHPDMSEDLEKEISAVEKKEQKSIGDIFSCRLEMLKCICRQKAITPPENEVFIDTIAFFLWCFELCIALCELSGRAYYEVRSAAKDFIKKELREVIWLAGIGNESKSRFIIDYIFRNIMEEEPANVYVTPLELCSFANNAIRNQHISSDDENDVLARKIMKELDACRESFLSQGPLFDQLWREWAKAVEKMK